MPSGEHVNKFSSNLDLEAKNLVSLEICIRSNALTLLPLLFFSFALCRLALQIRLCICYNENFQIFVLRIMSINAQMCLLHKN